MHVAKLAASAGALALAVTGAVGLLAPTSSSAATSVYSVAPYVDMSNGQEGLLDTAITQHGLKAYTAAFVLGEGCNQIWGDTLPIGADSFTDPLIAKAKSEGASVIVSSGGASGEPLAWTCSTQSSIDAGYQAIINDYGVTQLDFDVEGAAVADTAAAARQMQAMKDLKASNPNLQFSMTLPVLTSGLTGDGVNILKAAKNAGIRIDVVNIMTMDYYAGTGTEMGQGAVAAAQATLAQMQSVDPGYSYANLGITPMIGKNDDGSTFTLADAQTVESFAAQHGVGRLAFWSVNRDQPCSGSANSLSTCSEISQSTLAFTDAFVPYEGSSGGGGGSSSDFSLSSPRLRLGRPGRLGDGHGHHGGDGGQRGGRQPERLRGAFRGQHHLQPQLRHLGRQFDAHRDGRLQCCGGHLPDHRHRQRRLRQPQRHLLAHRHQLRRRRRGRRRRRADQRRLRDRRPQPVDLPVRQRRGQLPVHSGSHALLVVPGSSTTGECDQAVTLQPNHSYTLTGWVQGPYAYIGVSGGASASTWSSGSRWNQLKVTFTTGSSGAVTVFVHGWYGQGNVSADDFTLS
ncbi:hypothetical protein ACFQZC_32775 [Streptacidiphilus monticola]